LSYGVNSVVVNANCSFSTSVISEDNSEILVERNTDTDNATTDNDKEEDLQKFVSAFAESILDGHKGFIAGGVFKDYLTSRAIKDIDVFFESEEDFNDAVKLFSERPGFEKKYDTENSIGFYDYFYNVTIDLVRKNFGSPEAILSDFDYTVTQFALVKGIIDKDFVGENFTVDYVEDSKKSYSCVYYKDYYDHLNNRLLVPNLSKENADGFYFITSSLERLSRYIGYGFKPADSNYSRNFLLKFCESFSELSRIDLDKAVSRFNEKAYEEIVWFRSRVDAYENKEDNNMFDSFIEMVEHMYVDSSIYLSSKEMFAFDFFERGSYSSHFDWTRHAVWALMYFDADLNKEKVISELKEIYNKFNKYFKKHDLDYFHDENYSFLAVRFLKEIYRKKDCVSAEDLYNVFNLVFLYNFVSIKKQKINDDKTISFSYVNYSNRKDMSFKDDFILNYQSKENMKNVVFGSMASNIDNSLDIFIKILSKDNSDEWFKSCVEFFNMMYILSIETFPSFQEWHNALDSDLFDAEINPVLMLPLMLENEMDN